MAELGIKSGTIVTKNEDGKINVEGRTIAVVPIWRFLLDVPDSIE
jgi:predicted AAA+ superfamily ATPase